MSVKRRLILLLLEERIAFDAAIVHDIAQVTTDSGATTPTDIIEPPAPPGGATVLITSEDGTSAAFSIALSSQPLADVIIPLVSSDLTEGSAADAVFFNALNWNIPQTIVISGVADDIVDGDMPYTIITRPAVSDDLVYRGLDSPDIDLVNLDTDIASVIITPISPSPANMVTEEQAGNSATFTVELSSQPLDDVNITISSSDTSEGLPLEGAIRIPWQMWNMPQTLEIAGQQDFVVDGNIPYSISFSASSNDLLYNDIPILQLPMVNIDDDRAAIVLNKSQVATSESGGSDNFTIALTSEPIAPVALSLSVTEPAEAAITPSALLFAPGEWNSPKTISVTGLNDFIFDNNTTFTIVTEPASSVDTNYNNLDAADLQGVNKDDGQTLFVNEPSIFIAPAEPSRNAISPAAMPLHKAFIIPLERKGHLLLSTQESQATIATWGAAGSYLAKAASGELLESNSLSKLYEQMGFGGAMDLYFSGDIHGIIIPMDMEAVVVKGGDGAEFSIMLSNQSLGIAGVGEPPPASGEAENAEAEFTAQATGMGQEARHPKHLELSQIVVVSGSDFSKAIVAIASNIKQDKQNK